MLLPSHYKLHCSLLPIALNMGFSLPYRMGPESKKLILKEFAGILSGSFTLGGGLKEPRNPLVCLQ